MPRMRAVEFGDIRNDVEIEKVHLWKRPPSVEMLFHESRQAESKETHGDIEEKNVTHTSSAEANVHVPQTEW